MDNKILREKLKKIFDIRQIFLDAKNDDGDTFIKEINKLDKNILKKQLEFYKQGTIEKVKKVRYDIIKYILDGNKISKEKILEFKENEAKKYNKRIFKSWTFFSILHSIYYFDKKEFVINFLEELNERLILDLGISDYVKVKIVDFQGAQNFGLENFWTAIYNKNHKSQKTAKQLNITSFGNNGESLDYGYLSIGLGNGPEAENVSDRNHNFFHINELTYEVILEEFEKYKNIILKDKEFYIDNQNIMIKDLEQKIKLLDKKKQIILYGPPGTGKTYNIKNIIEKHSGEEYEDLKEEGRVEFITFHQSFSYEEFIEGIKAETENGQVFYKIESGIFKQISQRARENYENSKKTIKDLEKEQNLKNNLLDFLNELLEEGKKLQKTKGGTFEIVDINNDEIRIFSEESKHTDGNLVLNIEDLLKILNFKYKIKSARQLAKEIFGRDNQRQTDTYYFSIFKKFQNYKNNKSENKTTTQTELKNYYLIIDEINRGNISRIFGELITLLEEDKRNENWKIKLPYLKKDFWISENLYIIATMNTSDKSIVSLDTALRRRFGFVEMLPDYNLKKLQKEINGIKLADILEKLNNRIEYLLDKDHLIGHSYFLQKIEDIGDLKRIFINEFYPLLEEYFYSEEENIRKVLGKNFFEEQKIDSNLFEEKIEEEEKKYIFNKEISDKDFENALKNIIGK